MFSVIFFKVFEIFTQLVQDYMRAQRVQHVSTCSPSPPIEQLGCGNGMSGGRWDMVLSLLSEMLSRSTTPNEITLTTATWILEQ